METLAKLFSSGTLVKVMRLFLFNPEVEYDKDDIASKTKSPKKSVTYETKLLTEVGFLKKKKFSKTVKTKGGERKRKVSGWVLDESFPYLGPLKALLVNTELMNKGDLEKRLSKIGTVKLIIVGGVFMGEHERRIDLLLVGERIQQAKLVSAVKALESAIGTELRYTVLPPNEFEYRLGVRDRLLRDLFDYPHLVVKKRLKNIDFPKG